MSMPEQGELTSAQRPSRARRIRWIVGLLLFVMAVIVGYKIALPMWVHGKILSELRGAGIDDAHLDIDTLSASQIEISNLSLGKQRQIQVHSARVTYDIDSLQRGEVGLVRVEDAVLEMRLREEGVDLGPVDSLKGGDRSKDNFPFKKVELKNASVLVDWYGMRMLVPIDATLDNLGAGKISVDATIRIAQGLRMRGTFLKQGETWQVDLKMDPLEWKSGTRAVSVKSATLAGSVGDANRRWTLAIEGVEVSASAHAIRGGKAAIQVNPGDAKWITGEISTESVVTGTRTWPGFSGTIGTTDDRVSASFAWPVVKDQPVTANLWIDRGFTAEANASLPTIDLKASKEWFELAAEFVPQLRDFTGEGTLSANAQLKVESGGITPSVTVRATDVNVKHTSGVFVSGISGEFSFNPLSPLNAVLGKRIQLPVVAVGPDAIWRDVALRVDTVSDSLIELSDFSVGTERRLRADLIQLRFEKNSQGNRAFSTLMLRGALWDVKVRNGAVDLGPVSEILKLGKSDDKPGPKDAVKLVLPHVSFHESSIVVDWEGVRVDVPIAASMMQSANGNIQVAAAVAVAEKSIRLAGTMTPASDAGFDVEAKIEVPDVKWGGTQASVKNARITGGIGAKDSSLQLAISDANFSNESAALSGISLTLPIALSGAAKQGVFKVEGIKAAGRNFPAVTGTLNFADRRLEFSADWPLLKTAPVAVKGWFDASFRGEATANTPTFEIAKAKELVEFAPMLDGLDMDGKVSVEATAKYADGRLSPRVTLRVKDARFADEEAKLSVEGISGDVIFTRFSPLGTRGGQRFTIDKLTMGDVHLVKGEIRFQLERPDSFLIEKSLWKWDDGGVMQFYGVRIETGKAVAAEVFFEDVAMQKWVSLLVNAIGGEGDKVVAKGRLYGRVPIGFDVNNKKRPLTFGRGFLYANPGGGILKLNDKRIVSSLAQGLNADAILGEVRARFEEGVSNFEYSELKFDFIPDADQFRGVLFTKGKSLNPDRPVNFQGLTANFFGLDDGLNEAIMTKTSMQKIMSRFTPAKQTPGSIE